MVVSLLEDDYYFKPKRQRNPLSFLLRGKLNQGHHHSNHSTTDASSESKGLFGLTLRCTAQCGMTTVCHGYTVPDPVAQCFTEIIHRGLRVEGLFRLSGAASDVRQLSQEFDMGNSIDLSTYDIHAITGVVKKYLRSLPDPVIPHAYHNAFLRAASSPSSTTTTTTTFDVKELLNLISTLPLLHRHLLCFILHLTSEIQKHVDINMMNPEALAVVLAPVSTGLEQSLPNLLPSSSPHPFMIGAHGMGRRGGGAGGVKLPKREEMNGLIQTNAKWTYLWTLMMEHRETLLQHHELLERETTPSPVYPPYNIFMNQFESEPSDDDDDDDDQDEEEEPTVTKGGRRQQQQQQDQWWRGLFSSTTTKISHPTSDQTGWSSASAGPRRVLRRLASVSSMRPPSLHHWR
ncbi:Rho GTPase activation protein [Phascolomyces articulosus]|uniref:Rho GTPase activation protein n=1 Tax=Phascolomyces articulosus TaxID=60185 RepID=A0AAD5PBR2_9FUNG|nr:Rho GTPase activation protein [Phascolomyces articulosus]